MKRIFIVFVILANSIQLFAESSYSNFHKQKLIDYINKGSLHKAVNEISYINEWTFNDRDKKLINVEQVHDFIGYLSQKDIPQITQNDIKLYLCQQMDICATDYYNEGKYTLALPYAEYSSDIRISVLGESHYESALAYNKLGVLYNHIGDYKKAEKCYLNALSILSNLLGEDNIDYLGTLSNLGVMYLDNGNYVQAEYYLVETEQKMEIVLGKKDPDYAVSLGNLGILYKEKGDYKKAEDYYLQALKITYNIKGKNLDYANILHNLGQLYMTIGDYAKAENYFLETLSIQESLIKGGHPDYATTLNSLGQLYDINHDWEKAEQYYLQSVKIRKSAIGENSLEYCASQVNLGNVFRRSGDYEMAMMCYCVAMLTIPEIVGEYHPLYALTLHNIGSLLQYIGDYSNAQKNYLQVLDIQKVVFGEWHLEYLYSLQTLGWLDYNMGECDKAENFFRQAFLICENIFIQSLSFLPESQRKYFWQRIQWLSIIACPQFSYRYSQSEKSISTFAYDNEVFTKGLLLSSVEAIKHSIFESGDTILINMWNELVGEKNIIMTLQEKTPQSPYIVKHKERAEQLEKEITKLSAVYRENQALWQTTWDSVRNHLQDNQAAIEYMVAPLNEDSSMYCALLLRHNNKYPELIPLFEEKEVTSLMNTATENLTSKTYSYNGNGEQLAQLVWGKILPYVKQGETIYFAPSGLLHQLAIEALPYDSTYTMADMYNLVRLSSTREIVTRKKEINHTTAVLYGGIRYNVDAKELLAESERYATTNLLASRGIEDETLNRGTIIPLNGTKTEVENINALLNQNNLQVQLFTATNANEESFKALSGKHRNIIHIATHGFFWADSTAQKKDYFSQRMMMRDIGDDRYAPPAIDPLNRCGLLFAGAQTAWSGHSADLPDGVQDGVLTAKEISLLDLRDADLVVLSACETGKGEITGDGVFGLQRAFKQAGAQTIIMSLWSVNDAATQLLMTEFYKNWIAKHQSKREAFKNAQNAVRAKYEEPFYWAGFIMLD